MQFDPHWNGNGFDETVADAIWVEFSTNLKIIVTEELALGTTLLFIQKNHVSKHLVFCFDGKPRSKIPVNVVTHHKHRRGNYCYDDTIMSITEVPERDFIVFKDPGYNHEDYI